MTDPLSPEARRPRIANPGLTRRRTVQIERVTLRPGPAQATSARSPRREAKSRHQWRVAQGAAALAMVAVVPLAHAEDHDDARFEPPGPVAVEVALAPEPIEPEVRPWLTPRVPIEASGAFDAMAKVDGVKANPYEETRPRVRMVKRTARVQLPAQRDGERKAAHEARAERAYAGPAKVSDLKANPYD